MPRDSERTRVAGAEASQSFADVYEMAVRRQREIQDLQNAGQILINPADRKWEETRQSRLLYYLHPWQFKETAMQDWSVFINDVRQHTGKHRHQGGLVIYVLEGKGHSVVEGERVDWEAGDVLLLPIRPGGVEHQHFNADQGAPCKWMAFIYLPYWDWCASEIVQLELAPEYKGRAGGGVL